MILPDWLYVHYLSSTSHLLMVFIYLPVLIFIGCHIYKLVEVKKTIKLPAVVLLIAIAFFAPVVDVMKTGMDMSYYCNNEHGLHIYKTVETDGIYGEVVDAKHYLGLGYQYVEKGIGAYEPKVYRFELIESELSKVEVGHIQSEYEVYREDNYLDNNIRETVRGIRQRNNGEVLGERKRYSALGGWFDHLTPSFGPIFWHCPSRTIGATEFDIKILIPKKGDE